MLIGGEFERLVQYLNTHIFNCLSQMQIFVRFSHIMQIFSHFYREIWKNEKLIDLVRDVPNWYKNENWFESKFYQRNWYIQSAIINTAKPRIDKRNRSILLYSQCTHFEIR